METFLSYLSIVVFWSFVIGIIVLAISTNRKMPKPRPLPLNFPTKFVGRVRMEDVNSFSRTSEKEEQSVLEYLGGSPTAR